MVCACRRSIDLGPPKVAAHAFVLRELPKLEVKAQVWPGTNQIDVSGPWWAGLSTSERAAVIAHERAHVEDPSIECESCIDKRAGAILRHERRGRWETYRAFARTVQGRRAGPAALEGWDAAEAAVSSKRLEGASPMAVVELGEDIVITGRAPWTKFAPVLLGGAVVLWFLLRKKG